MTRISARRAEVLASYGKRKPMNAKNKKPDNDLPIHAPIAWKKDIESRIEERNIRAALKDKPKLNLSDEDRAFRKLLANKQKNREVNGIHLDGLLTAAAAKKGITDKSSIGMETSAPYFNYQDNFIENQYHGKTSAFDVRHNDLIETDPDTGKMLRHGDTCAICKMPPSTVGEVMLAQYGQADFVCVDCGKLVETKGLGMRGWTFDTIKMAEEDDDE